MKRPDIQTLKEIALLGGVHDLVPVSSSEMAARLGLSQQAASKRVLDLVEQGLVERDMRHRKQRVRLTKEGLETLRGEHADYMRIFEVEDFLTIHGTVFTGLGEGAFYMSQEGYVSQFQEKLWFKPWPGTLNLRVEGRDRTFLEVLSGYEGIVIDGFESEGRTFGAVKAWFASIGSVDCAAIMPVRTHYADVLEVISKSYLRETVGLADGDVVELVVRL
jgi:riboflavin kinase